jgi:hypothetical protein
MERGSLSILSARQHRLSNRCSSSLDRNLPEEKAHGIDAFHDPANEMLILHGLFDLCLLLLANNSSTNGLLR